MKKHTSLLLPCMIIMLVLLSDRCTKYGALSLSHDVVITPFLSFSLAFNRGISWGYLDQAGHAVFVALSISISVIIALLIAVAYSEWRKGKNFIAESMIIAGASSNVVDRLLYGAVIDFIVVHYGGWEFPVFNIADTAIVAGVIMLLMKNFNEYT
jgi:signal peptidase II